MEPGPLGEAVARLVQLEDIEAQRADAIAKDRLQFVGLMDMAWQEGEKRLLELCELPDVRDALVAHLAVYRGYADDLSVVRASGSVEEPALAEQEEALRQSLASERRSDSRLRLAERVLGMVSIGGAQVEEQPSGVPDPSDTDNSRELVEAFFARPPDVVAQELLDRTLQVNGKTVKIISMRPQGREHNVKFLSRPIFGPDRRDVFIANFRGYKLLFLRAGDANNTDCCVCVVGVEQDGQMISTPGKVGVALELRGEQVGDLVFDGDTLQIINLEPRKKQRKSP